MKIAVPTRGTNIDDHFGHCEKYTIFSIDDNKNITHAETLPSPEGCGCKSNIASILQKQGVTVLLAGNMGDGALNVLSTHGIEVLRGNRGDVRAVTNAFLQGEIADSGEGCHAHENHGEDHQCVH
jgi:predicted Fe-Mo cluster-binding NifX family protein